MATTDNNLRVPDELREQAAAIAERQGRSADDLAADALKRYIAHDKLEELSRFGRERARELGLDEPPEEQVMALVERVIGEDRTERRR